MKEKEKDQIPKIDPAEIDNLIAKFEQNQLNEDEKGLITKLLRTLLMVVAILQEKKIKLQVLKDLIFGQRSEKRKKSAEEKAEEKKSETDAPGTEKKEQPPSDPKPKNLVMGVEPQMHIQGRKE